MRTNKIFFPIIFGILITLGLTRELALANGSSALSNAPTAAIIYVDTDATGAAIGTSWADAYTTLQDALSVAVDDNQIWVAAGVYYPDEGSGQSNDSLTSSFVLTDGVALYGGFDPGTGADTFPERDWVAHTTVLSGDIDHETFPDITDAHGVVTNTANILGSNAYHVVSSSGVTVTAILDGFSITAGKAYGAPPNDSGGGMFNLSSSPTLSNLSISGNTALFGGGMLNKNSSPTLIEVTFIANSAISNGGGIYNWNYSNPVLTNVIFSNNSANSDGGGMYNWVYCDPILTNVTFSDNSADYGGGMANDQYCNPSLIEVNFSQNRAFNSGGGIANLNNSSPTLADVVFFDNSGGYIAGGMYNSESSPVLSNVTFSENRARSGGGMYNVNCAANIFLNNVTFSDNVAVYDGAGILNQASNLTLNEVVFTDNSTGISGGGISNYNGSSLSLNNVVFSTNSAKYGGGISDSEGNLDLTNVIFTGNSSTEQGGGISNYLSKLTLSNVIFAVNSAKYGGGMSNSQSYPTLTNLSFYANSADQSGGGIYNNDNSYPTLKNSILWANTAVTGGSQIYNESGSGIGISYSDIQGCGGSQSWDLTCGSDGGNNLDADPLFERLLVPGDSGYGDQHPQPESPAIDSGTNTGCPPTDLDGNPRPANGVCDMGAYESQFEIYLPLVMRQQSITK